MKLTPFAFACSLGIIQVLTQSNCLYADECCETPCCEAAIVPGYPLDSCQIGAGYPYPATITLCDGWDVYAKGDFLYWISNMGVTIFEVSATTTNQQHTRDLFQKRSWDPGFRAALGADLGSVVLEAQYTRAHNENTTHFSARSGETLSFPTLAIPGAFATAKSKQQMFLDVVTVSLHKPFYIGTKLTLDGLYGILFGWNQLNLKINAAPLNIPPTAFAKINQKWWNVGPTWGLHSKILLCWGLRGIGNIDLSLSYGRTTTSSTQYTFPLNPAANLTQRTKHFSSFFSLNTLAELGLGWEGFFCCDAFHTELAVTYNFYQQNNAPVRGLQALTAQIECWHGIAIGCRVDF